jgi:hypothetical protein
VTELAFVMARRQNRFFVELVEAIRDELGELGVPSEVCLDGFPPPRSGLIYVLVPPHEYYALRGTVDPPSAPLLRRSIFICAEQPSSHFFNQNVDLASDAGAVLDISRQGVREWGRRGVAAEQFPLGYVRRWDRSPFDRPRDVDVAFLGSRSDRRNRLLAGYAPSLWRWRTHLLLSDNGRPNHAPGPDFVTGEAKRDLLCRTKVLLNLHVDDRPYCETLRIVEGILCGAVVVSEHSSHTAPLVPGYDFLSADSESVVLVAQHMLENDELRQQFVDRALGRLREENPLSQSVERLAEIAGELDRSAPVPTLSPVRVPEEKEPDFDFAPPSGVTSDSDASSVRRALKQLKIDLIAQRRRLDRLDALLEGRRPPEIEIVRSTTAYPGAAPRVSVIVSLYNYEDHIEAALDSTAGSALRSFELVVVDDGSKDGSLSRALAWCDRHGDIPAVVLHHGVNRGLPHARNAGVDFARGEFAFILDADNEVYPHCFSRLVEALDADLDAAFAYGMAERFDGSGPLGLLSVGAWEPERLRQGNYIDAMAMIRLDSLRELDGYTTDARLHGWEDYDLWCKVADRGWRGTVVREILGRYRVSAGSMLGTVTTLSGTDAYAALIDRHPELMKGITPPL